MIGKPFAGTLRLPARWKTEFPQNLEHTELPPVGVPAAPADLARTRRPRRGPPTGRPRALARSRVPPPNRAGGAGTGGASAPRRDRFGEQERERQRGRRRPRHVGRVNLAGHCGPGKCGQGPGAPPGGAAVPAAPVAARGPRGLRGGRSGGGSGRLSHPRGRRARRPDPGPALPAEPPEEGEQSTAGTWRAPGRRRPRVAASRAPRGPRPSSSSERGRGRGRARRGAGPGLLHHRRSRPR